MYSLWSVYNIVTELGRKLDCYALSLDNEEHWKWHKEHDETSAGNYSVAPNIAVEGDILKLF